MLNTALMTASSGYTFEEARADRSFWGRIVESAVGAHLHNTRTPGVRLYYWRHNGSEVDFVLARGPRLTAIEVKTGCTAPGRERTGGVQEAIQSPPAPRVVGTGGVALHEFLSETRRATGSTTNDDDVSGAAAGNPLEPRSGFVR